MDKNLSDRKCKNCNDSYTPYRSWQEFCSGACRSQYYERYVRHSCGEALKLLDETEGKNEKISGG